MLTRYLVRSQIEITEVRTQLVPLRTRSLPLLAAVVPAVRQRPLSLVVVLNKSQVAGRHRINLALVEVRLLQTRLEAILYLCPMFCPMFLTLLLLWSQAALVLAAASVSVVNPINEQFPLIARINSSYSWQFSSNTFSTTSGAQLTYNVSTLPGWLSFDGSIRAFSGTPTSSDEGSPRITVTATDSSTDQSASSWFTLCVTHYPPPQLSIPLAGQFSNTSNSTLSSTFPLSINSALASETPTLRVPSGWSFSLGFEGETFTGENDVFYGAMQADGSPLPEWMKFNGDAVTLNGVAPSSIHLPTPSTISLMLIGSDQKEYSAVSTLFDVVVAPHELSLATSSLPTINITSAIPFNITLNSLADFVGVLTDGKPIDIAAINSLDVDTSSSSWLKYDASTRALSGTPPDNLNSQSPPTLPVTLSTSFNQTLHTSVSLAAVPSYFSESVITPILVAPGQGFGFGLALSNLARTPDP